MESAKKYRVGIIGAGSIVESCHLPVLKNIENVSLEWIYDKRLDRSELLSRMFEVPSISNWEKMVNNIDICLVTIPYGARKNYLETLGDLKKAVYVEKPFALTVDEHKSWGAKFADHMLAVGFQRRFYKVVRDLSSIIANRMFGKLRKIVLRQGNFSLKGGAGYLSDVNLAGGGVIIESGIHSLDQLLCITRAHDIFVGSAESVCINGIDYDSIFSTVLKTVDGDVEVDGHMTTLQNLDNGIELLFDQAVVKTSLSSDATISIRINGQADFCLTSSGQDHDWYSQTVIGSFGGFWKTFLLAIESGNPNSSSFKSSTLTTKWIQEIYGKIR